MRMKKWIAPALLALGLTAEAHAQEAAQQAQPTPAVETGQNTAEAKQPSVIPQAAATYATFQGDIGEVSNNRFENQSQIEQSLQQLGGHNPDQLTGGWMSYSALVAAQNREFAASIHDIDAYYGRDRLLAALEKNPAYVTKLPGGEKALQAALSAAKADERRMASAAAFLQSQEAYLQNQDWIQQRIRDGKQRADALLSMSYSGRPVSSSASQLFSGDNVGNLLQNAGTNGATSVWDRASILVSNAPGSALSSITSGRTYSVSPGRTETTNHMASLAAYEIIGEATSSHTGVRQAMSDRKAKDCFDFAQIQLRGCVAGQSSHYGLQACLREHAISDVGECVGEVAR